MVILKDIDGRHRVFSDETIQKYLMDSLHTIVGLTLGEMLDLKRLADTFGLGNAADINSFIHQHSNCTIRQMRNEKAEQ